MVWTESHADASLVPNRVGSDALSWPPRLTGDSGPQRLGLSPTGAAARGRVSFWDPATGRFDPTRLRGAIVARGWTVREFAAAAAVSHESVYRALRQFAVSDRTVVRMIAALESRLPSGLIDG